MAFRVVGNYKSYAELFEAGKYDWAGPKDALDNLINYPLGDGGVFEVNIEIVHMNASNFDNDPQPTYFPELHRIDYLPELNNFDHNLGQAINIDNLMAGFKKNHQRLATLPEFMALGAQHPNEQRKYAIFTFGPIRFKEGIREIAYLFGDSERRGLALGCMGSNFAGSFRFAVVSNS